ncbi:MAG: TolC family protein [Saprospiraceae bacterium]|nr:TolC family protein [Saprospiraceae bacterium]NNK90446.1 TolC family protein [Saprospiraceae bacterium]
MIKCLIIAISLVFSSGLIAQNSFSLDEAIEYAISHSNNMKLARLEVEKANSQIIEYRAIGLPQVDAALEYQYYFEVPVSPVEDFVTPAVYGVLAQEFQEIEPFQGQPETFEFSIFRKNNLSARIDARWLVLDGSYFSGLKAAKMFRELTRKTIDVSEEDIRANVTKAYMNTLIAGERKDIIRKNISNIEDALSDTRAFYENGFMEKLDVERLELTLENLKTEFEKTDQLIDLGLNLLKFQMAYPINERIELTEDLDIMVDRISIEDVNLDEEIDYYKKARYEEIILGKEINQLNLERLKRGYYPSLSAKASFSESLQREKLTDENEIGWIPTGSVSLGINVPIFDGLMKKGQIQQAKIVIDQIEIQKSEFERAVNLQVSNSRLQYINARKTLQSRKRSLDIVQRIYEKTMIKFNEGVGSSVEVTQAENQLYDAQGNYIVALYDLLIAKTDLDIALGNI